MMKLKRKKKNQLSLPGCRDCHVQVDKMCIYFSGYRCTNDEPKHKKNTSNLFFSLNYYFLKHQKNIIHSFPPTVTPNCKPQLQTAHELLNHPDHDKNIHVKSTFFL